MAELILIVDDEKDLLDTLAFNFEQEGFRTATAGSGRAAMERLKRDPLPDLVLLDLMLPDISGIEVCRSLRRAQRTARLPVVMLTARDEEIDRVIGFEVGADDYVVKPFSVREVILRVRAVLRRAAQAEPAREESTDFGRLRLDTSAHGVWVDQKEVRLTALEFKLLATLLQRRGRVQSRDRLLSDVWGINADVTTRTVDTHVKRLREKLGPAGAYIETLRGVGYRINAQPVGETD